MTSGIGHRAEDLWNDPVHLFGHRDEEENLKKLQAGVDNTVQALLRIEVVTAFVNDLIEKNHIRLRTDIQPSRVAKTSVSYKNAFNEIVYVASTVAGHRYLTAIHKAMQENLKAYFDYKEAGRDGDDPSANTSAAQSSLAIIAKTLPSEAEKTLHELLQPFDVSLDGAIVHQEALEWIREFHSKKKFAFKEEIPLTLDEAYKRLADFIARKEVKYFTLRNVIEFGTLNPIELIRTINFFDRYVKGFSPEDLGTITGLLPPFEETLRLKLIDSFRTLAMGEPFGVDPSVLNRISAEEISVKLADVWWSSEGREYFNIRFIIVQKEPPCDIALRDQLDSALNALDPEAKETINTFLLPFESDDIAEEIDHQEALEWIREFHSNKMFAFREEIPVTLDEAYKRLADIIARKGEEYFTLRNTIEFETLNPIELIQKIDDFDGTVKDLSPKDLGTIAGLLPPFEATLRLKLIGSFRELGTKGWLGLDPSVLNRISPEEVSVKLADVWWSSEGREYFNIRFIIVQKEPPYDIALLHKLESAFKALNVEERATINEYLLEFDPVDFSLI